MTILEQTVRSKGRPLIGAVLLNYNPSFVDIVSRLGYDALWLEMEHMPLTFPQVADLTRIASGLGMLTMIRVPDSRRENVLRAAECGPDIIDLPMANTPEVLQELVRHARYAPEGGRGFFGSSRAVGYSIEGDIADIQQQINRDLCLMFQIETKEAVERADELCQVPGTNAIFIGPGDLSASFGVPGQTHHPVVEQAKKAAVDAAKASDKLVAMASAPSDVGLWWPRGVSLFFISGDISMVSLGAQTVLDEARRSCE